MAAFSFNAVRLDKRKGVPLSLKTLNTCFRSLRFPLLDEGIFSALSRRVLKTDNLCCSG